MEIWGIIKKAIHLLKEALSLYKKNSYETYSCFSQALEWLGRLYIKQGDCEKAKALCNKYSTEIYNQPLKKVKKRSSKRLFHEPDI